MHGVFVHTKSCDWALAATGGSGGERELLPPMQAVDMPLGNAADLWDGTVSLRGRTENE